MTIRLKKQNWMMTYYIVGIILVLAVIGVGSWLLGSNIQQKGGDQVKTTIITSIVFYGGMLWLGIKVLLGSYLFYRNLKKINNNEYHIVQELAPSKYKPDTIKSKQPFIKNLYKEKKLGDSYMRITPKEIVIVYDKEFKSKEDYYKSIKYTLGELQEEIRKLEDEKKESN